MSVSATNYDSHTSHGLYAGSVGTTNLVANSGTLSAITITKGVVTSISQLAGINWKKNIIKATTGVDSYAVTGLTSTDVIVACLGLHFSEGGLFSAGTVTTSNSGRTGSISLTAAITSGGVAILDWLDISV